MLYFLYCNALHIYYLIGRLRKPIKIDHNKNFITRLRYSPPQIHFSDCNEDFGNNYPFKTTLVVIFTTKNVSPGQCCTFTVFKFVVRKLERSLEYQTSKAMTSYTNSSFRKSSKRLLTRKNVIGTKLAMDLNKTNICP